MTIATLLAVLVLIFAILVVVGFFPVNNVTVGLLIGTLAGAILVGRL